MIDFGASQSPKSTRPLTTYWCPSRPGHQALRNNFASSLLLRTWLPYDWTPRSEAYFVFPLAQGTPGKQCGLAATGVYQPSLRSPWLAAKATSLSKPLSARRKTMMRPSSNWRMTTALQTIPSGVYRRATGSRILHSTCCSIPISISSHCWVPQARARPCSPWPPDWHRCWTRTCTRKSSCPG